MSPQVIVALDFPEPAPADALIERLPADTWFKVGLELFTRAGPGFVERLTDEGRRVFLDLKLHDIPNTVAGAVRAASRLGTELLTIHASGGTEMMRAAVEAAADGAGPRPRLLAITVLTSLDDDALARVLGGSTEVAAHAARLAGLAHDAGVDGAVCSVGEAVALRRACGEEFLLVTPGIRMSDEAADDQRRVYSPADARAAGADFIVVGRSITRAPDPARALATIRASLVSSRGSESAGAPRP